MSGMMQPDMHTETMMDKETRRRCFEKDVKTMTQDELLEAMRLLEAERKAIMNQVDDFDTNIPFKTKEDVRHAA